MKIPKAQLSPYSYRQEKTGDGWVNIEKFKGNLNGNIPYYLSPPGDPLIPEGQRIPLVPITWEGKPCSCRPIAEPPSLDAWKHERDCTFSLEPFYFQNTTSPDWWTLDTRVAHDTPADFIPTAKSEGRVIYRIYENMIDPKMPVDRFFRPCQCTYKYFHNARASHAEDCKEKEVTLRAWWNQKRTGRWDLGWKTVVEELWFEKFLVEYKANKDYGAGAKLVRIFEGLPAVPPPPEIEAVLENRKFYEPREPYQVMENPSLKKSKDRLMDIFDNMEPTSLDG